MLLSLWSGFYNEADWIPGPASKVVGAVRVFNGSAFIPGTLKVYNGSQWIERSLYYYK